MSDHPMPLDRLAEVERLTAALTDQILDAQITNRPISEDQIQALAKAARMLHDSDIPWPPMLSQVLNDLAQDRTEPEPDPSSEATDDSALNGLSRFLGTFRRDRGQGI